MRSSANGEQVMGGATRANYGVTVSASSADRKQARVFYEVGSPLEVLREICARIDRLPGRWYIDAISTPDTIYADLHNNGRKRIGDHRWRRERNRLSRIGRLDLLRVPLVSPKREP